MVESIPRRGLSSSSTYRVRVTELAQRRKPKYLSATVTFLDDTQHTFQVERKAKGKVLLDSVFRHLELVEKEYFGLQYADCASSTDTNVMRWLDSKKLIKKQIRSEGCELFFRVKFYISDPSKLQEEYTRYQIYLQVRRDILEGRLEMPRSTACLIASYIIQSELGDYEPDVHSPGYLSQFQLFPGQNEEMEETITELHRLHKGQLPADAEFNFLDHAKRLDMYGVDLHLARDAAHKEVQLGVTSDGLLIFHNNIKINILSWSKIVKISFKRKEFFVQLRREQSESYDTLLGFDMRSYRSSKTLWKSCIEHYTFFRLHSPKTQPRRFPLTLSSRFIYSGRTEFQTVEDGKNRVRIKKSFTRSPSRKISNLISNDKKSIKFGRSTRSYDKVQSLGTCEPRQAWVQRNISDDEGGFLNQREESTALQSQAFPLGFDSEIISYADDDAVENSSDDFADCEDSSQNVKSNDDVVVKLVPDDQGCFGFNVKGGLEFKLPVIISRVVPNSPADRCYPKLNVGDQVICINGIDVTDMLHDNIVSLIRQCHKSGRSELSLTVRSNLVYNSEKEPFLYVPNEQVTAASDVTQSIMLLADKLGSGALVNQYEQLYTRNPELSTLESGKFENRNKNRYRDISPYDITRVILLNGEDYINANYINMEIPGSGIINRYIATQGPLSNTVDDFWQMVFEAGSTLIVMLTTLMECGRVKCNQYWPNPFETLTSRNLTLTCKSETIEDTVVLREFELYDENTNEKREVSHVQYCSWPDHGVPDDWMKFVTFTQRIRAARTGHVQPAVVHCSAGIGRTGMLILMETALCLIEANQPVYPLEIVQLMRNQRAMMIQNVNQYRFVCEAVYESYCNGIVKPLPEYYS